MVILGLLAVAAQAQQDYSAWTYGKRITLNTSGSGADVSGALTDFPVLIRLNSSNFNFSQANSSGNDIRFATETNTPLSYEIERWDASAQRAEIWVLVPSIQGSNSTQNIRMYWGNSGASSESNANAVFPTSNNFVGVWHVGDESGINERPNAVSGAPTAKLANHGGTFGDGGNYVIPDGAIGKADVLRGGGTKTNPVSTSDYINIGNSSDDGASPFEGNNTYGGYSDFSNGFTFSMWVNPATARINQWTYLMELANGSNCQDNIQIFRPVNIDSLRFEHCRGTQSQGIFTTATAGEFAAGQWSYHTVVIGTGNTPSITVYRNGVAETLTSAANGGPTPDGNLMPNGLLNTLRSNAWLGKSNYGQDGYFAGTFDEPRISNAPRSADWIKLSYENQRPSGQSFAVVDGTRPPVDLSYSQGEVLQYEVGQPITNNTISYKGTTGATYSISPTLPEGLNFDTQTGTISGTPTTATPAAAYTVTVNNSDGSDNITLNITVVGPPTNLAYSQGTNLTYILGQAITPNTLSFNNGPATSITISPPLPTGLSFNSSNGTISGTPSARADSADYTVTVTNNVDNAQITLSIAVLEAPSISGYSLGLDHTYFTDSTIATNILNFSGGTPDNINITPSLPAGLNFNSSTGNISGTPTTSSADQAYTVVLTNGAGSDSITLMIEVLAPISNVSYSLGRTSSHVIGVPVNNDLTYTGDPLTSTGVTPPLPAGLSLNDSGDIVGTPTTATPQATYTVTLTNAAGSVEVPLTITITSSATEPSNVNYTGGTEFTWSEGDSVNTGPINFDGTHDASVQVTLSSASPTLPEGLSLNPTTGAITGRPTSGSPSQNYTIIVSNSGGSDSVTIAIEVGVPPPSNLRYSNEKNLISYLVGQEIVPNQLTWDGGQTINAQVTTPVGVLPGGLSLDAATGTISGTPTTVTPPRGYTITITNEGGSETITLTMEVVDATGATLPSGLVYELGNTMQFVINRPIAPNPLTYSGTEATSVSINPDLQTNTGLQIDGLTGTISGTPTTLSPLTPYTISVVNAAGTAQLSINLAVVSADIAPTSPQYSEGTDLDYLINVPIPTNRLSYTGTQATFISIDPPLPAGLNFDTQTGTISGTPTAISLERNYGVTIENPVGTISFNISLSVTQKRSSLIATVSKPQANSTLGNPLVSYTLNGAVQSGTVSWVNGVDDLGNPVPDAYNNQVATLTGAALDSGTHTNVTLTGLNLLPGGRYEVLFEFVDGGGAPLEPVSVPRVRISKPLAGLRISPSNQSISLEQSVSFRAVGLEVDTVNNQQVLNEVDVSPITWTSVDGKGNVDANGSFTPLALGVTRVAAGFGNLTDTATVNVIGATVTLPAGGNDTISVGQTIEILLPVMTSFVGANLGITQVATTAIPQGLVVAGPAIMQQVITFEQPVTYRLRVDPSVTGTPNVYRRKTDGNWELIPSTREGDWLVVSLTETGTLVVAVDTSAPTVQFFNSTPQRTATQGQGMNITFAGSDNIANPTVTLVITSAGRETRLPIDFLGNGQQTGYNIDGSHVSRLGLFYHIEIFDGTNVTATDAVDVLVTVTDSLSNPNTLALNVYDMFSIPMRPKAPTVSDITTGSGWPASGSGVEWRIFGWENNALAEKTETSQLAPGASYFVRTNNFNPALSFASGSMESLPYSTPYDVALSTNWNVFGNPFLFNVDVASIQAVNTELVYFYVFENQTFRALLPTEAIEPWKGYLVWNGTPAKRTALSIPGVISGGSLAKLPVQQVAGLTLESQSGKDGYLQFGVSGGVDGHPKPDLVPGGPKVWLLSDKGKVMTDYRGDWEEGQRFTIGLSYNPGDEARLVFHDLYRLGDEVGVRLVSKRTGEVYEVEDGAARLSGPPESEMELLVGPADYLEAETQSVLLEKRTLFLGQNVPNPFRASTSIRYQVPGTAGEWRNVRLEVFDLQGGRVKSLMDDRALAGEYRVQWDGTSDRGTLLPSGTYFYRLSIQGERQLQRKLILLK